MCFFFFFQAEDGIRDWSVTGVQTCALPIWPLRSPQKLAQEEGGHVLRAFVLRGLDGSGQLVRAPFGVEHGEARDLSGEDLGEVAPAVVEEIEEATELRSDRLPGLPQVRWPGKLAEAPEEADLLAADLHQIVIAQHAHEGIEKALLSVRHGQVSLD